MTAPLRPQDKQRNITLVFGKTGMGKTEWTKQYIAPLPRVIGLDPMLEYPGMLTFDTMPDMIDHIQKYRAWQVRSEFALDFELLCKTAWAAQDCTLLIEESQRVIPPGLFRMPKAFEDLVYRGRHRRVSLVLVAQRAHTVHIMPRSQFTRMIVFAQTEKADVAWLRDVTGFDIDPVALPPLSFYDITPSSVALRRLKFASGQKYATILGDAGDASSEAQPTTAEEDEP